MHLQTWLHSSSVFPEVHEAQMMDSAQGVSADKETSISRKIPADKILLMKTHYKKDTLWKLSLCVLKDIEYFTM